jgi:pyruvate formate lyase activating enzyme
MRDLSIKGFLPTSLLDWPGRICAVLFLAGCNFRCPFCHNVGLVREADGFPGVDWGLISAHLEARRGWIDGVCITGGEPTLHAQLPRLAEEIRSLGLLVKLDTNGSRPEVLRLLAGEGRVDHFSMDVKTSLGKYPLATRSRVSVEAILRSIDIIKGSGIEHEFRCTVVPGLVDLADLRQMAQRLMGAEVLTLQQFRAAETLDPSFGSLKPYPDETLLQWAEQLSPFLPTRVRGIQAVGHSQRVAS